METLLAFVRRAGGVVRRRAVIDAGFRPRVVATAVADARLIVPRRGWIAVPDADPFEGALAVWESALNSRVVEKAELARLPLKPAARRLLEVATPFSDSGLETFVGPRLAWMRVPVRPQIWIHGHRVDFLIGDRLILQIDGGHHVGIQRTEDVAHDAALMLLGFHVIRVTYVQVVERWHEVQELIMRAVAQGLHRAA